MLSGLLAVALGAAVDDAVALGAVSLGFFFFSGDFILFVEVVPDIDFSLSSRIDLFGICLLSMESEKGKKSGKDETKRHSSENWGRSTYWDKHIGVFTADAMTKCIAEIREAEAEAAWTGTQPKMSRNQATQYCTFALLFFSSPDELLSL